MHLGTHVSFLKELEALVPVELWRVGDLRVWPLVRYLFSVNNLSLINRTRGPPKPRLQRLKELVEGERRWVRAELSDRSHSAPMTRPADVLLYGDGVSLLEAGGAWFDRFCDPIAARTEALGFVPHVWVPLHRYQVPRARPSAFIQPLLDVQSVRCKLTWRTSPPATLEGFDQFCAFVRERFPEAWLPNLDDVTKVGHYVEGFTAFYRRQLERIRPRACFIVSYYGTERFSFVRACRQLGVPVVDVQHGYSGDRHWAYSGWTRLPKGGFDVLPSVFWRWGPEDRAVIDAWAGPSDGAHRAEVVGNLFLNAWWQGEFPNHDEARRRASTVRARAGARVNVLLTLNGFEPASMLDSFATLIERERGRLFFWLRTHPSRTEQREVLKARLREHRGDVCIDEATDLPLPVVLEVIDVHVTEISTTVMEAELFGVPSVILGSTRSVLYDSEIRRGIARVVDSVEDLPASLLSMAGARPRRERDCFARSYDHQLLAVMGRAEG